MVLLRQINCRTDCFETHLKRACWWLESMLERPFFLLSHLSIGHARALLLRKRRRLECLRELRMCTELHKQSFRAEEQY